MPIAIKQNEYVVINLSCELSEDDYISTTAVLTGCSSFSVIGINEKNEYIGLFGHAGGGIIDSIELEKFTTRIKSENIRQLNILDITLTKYAEQRAKEPYMNENALQWVNELLENQVIDGYKLSTKISSYVDGVRYTQSGIIALPTCTPKAIKQFPDISKGRIDQIDHLNDIETVKPKKQTSTITPILDLKQSQKDEKSGCCILL
ncbi:hypothetical protein L3V83_00325 [Thiotrichales bacterium 19X7-9]|nr:hypothetical protein [Thiotrichales bacterium 19X7-9]